MDDLDFSKPAGAPKPAAPPAAAQPQAPIYIPAIARAFFESVGKEETVAAGTVIFAENEKASRILLKRDKMYYLLEGQVGLMAKGKAIGAVKVGHIFGEMAAITESPRSATAVAMTECRVLSLDDKQFQSALERKPDFALMLMALLIQRLRAMVSKLSGIPSAAAAKEESRVFDKNMLAQLTQGLGERAVTRYPRGGIIMVQGQAGALMYVVTEGRVAISLRGAVVERVGPGGVFGEMALIDQSPRAANAAWDAVRDHIVNPIRNAVSTVRDALGSDGLLGWLRDKAEDMANAAQKLAQPFISAFGKMKDAVKEVVGSMNTGKDLLARRLHVEGVGGDRPLLEALGHGDRGIHRTDRRIGRRRVEHVGAGPLSGAHVGKRRRGGLRLGDARWAEEAR